MATVTVGRHDDWTVDDLEHLPDDGHRYELVDGRLVVSPAPVLAHQRVAGALYRLRCAACPAELEVFFAPVDFQPSRRRSLRPDVLVARRDSIGEKNITVAPVLVVEVLSPGTKTMDQVLKRELYQSSGVDSYWMFDPDVATLYALDLVDGAYRLVGTAEDTERLELSRPFPVVVVPADLIAGR